MPRLAAKIAPQQSGLIPPCWEVVDAVKVDSPMSVSPNSRSPADAKLRILLIDRDVATVPLVRQAVSDVDVEIVQTANDFDRLLQRGHHDLVLLAADWFHDSPASGDFMRSLHQADRSLPVIVLLDASSSASDRAMQLVSSGAIDCLAKPLNVPRLAARIAAANQSRRLLRTPVIMTADDSTIDRSMAAMVGTCESMLAAYRAIGQAAAHSSPVLIRGESGTGRTTAAARVHRLSATADQPLRFLACEGCSQTTIDEACSTGASGYLVLENIDKASTLVQAHVMEMVKRCLQNPTEPSPRLILTASMSQSESGQFRLGTLRPELFYCLRGGAIELPPLRERGRDTELLVQQMVTSLTGVMPIEGRDQSRISPEAIQMIRSYPWPGNVAELKSVVRAALQQSGGALAANEFLRRLTRPPMLLAPVTPLMPAIPVHAEASAVSHDDFFDAIPSPKTQPYVQLRSPDYWAATVDQLLDRVVVDPAAGSGPDQRGSEQLSAGVDPVFNQAVEAAETGLIAAVLRRTGGNLAQSARLLGLSRVSLRKKIHALGLVIPGRGIST